MNQEQEKNNKGIDLNNSSNDSDTGVKSQTKERRSTQIFLPRTPKIIQWVMKYSGGLIKDEKQANYVLLGFVAVAIIVSLFLFFGGEKAKIEAPPGQRIIYPSNEPPRLQQ